MSDEDQIKNQILDLQSYIRNAEKDIQKLQKDIKAKIIMTNVWHRQLGQAYEQRQRLAADDAKRDG
jgi:hypothetical protein